METLSFHAIAKPAAKPDSAYVDNLILLEQAIKDNHEKIRTFTPLMPIIGAGTSARPSFLARLKSLDPASPPFNMDISGSDSDWSVADNDSDTDVAERV